MKRLLYMAACALALLVGLAKPAAAEPLKVAYSDWPGWVAWEIAIQKGWFKEAGVDIEFKWLEYAPSMEAFSAGKVDAVCMTNGDAMVTGAAGKPSTCIVLNDFSNGNDMIVAAAGIKSMKDLKGKKISSPTILGVSIYCSDLSKTLMPKSVRSPIEPPTAASTFSAWRLTEG